MPEPYNYTGILAQQPTGGMADIVKQALFGEQQRQQNENTLAQQQIALDNAKAAQAVAQEQRARQVAAWQAVVKDPNPQNVGLYMMAVPEQADAFKKGWDVLDQANKDSELRTGADAVAALNQGNYDQAKAVLTARRDAEAKAGGDPAHWDALINLIDGDPAHARALGNIIMAQMAGPDKFAEAYAQMGGEQRAQDKAPAELKTAESEAAIKGAEAAAKPQMIQSDLDTQKAQRTKMANDSAIAFTNAQTAQGQLALDREKLATEAQLKMAEIEANAGKLSDSALKIVNDAATASSSAQMLADREDALAERIKSSGMSWGPFASLSGFLQQNGFSDGSAQLRAEWQQLKNNAALANRKNMPGAMSDADRNFLLKGFPGDNAAPSYIARFLGVMAKGQRAEASYQDALATWASANGSLGPARSPIVVNGMRVPAGMTFAAFMAAMAKISPSGPPPDAQGVIDRARK